MDKKHSSMAWILFLIIIAVIAIVVVAKYNRFTHDFEKSISLNLASTLSSSSATNYIQRKSKLSNGIKITNCKDVINIVGADLPKNYQIKDEPIEADETIVCHLTSSQSGIIEFNVIGVK